MEIKKTKTIKSRILQQNCKKFQYCPISPNHSTHCATYIQRLCSKVTPDCLKSNIDEVKKKIGGDEKNVDPDDPANKGKITEWEAGWNVTNAIQVSFIF